MALLFRQPVLYQFFININSWVNTDRKKVSCLYRHGSCESKWTRDQPAAALLRIPAGGRNFETKQTKKVLMCYRRDVGKFQKKTIIHDGQSTFLWTKTFHKTHLNNEASCLSWLVWSIMLIHLSSKNWRVFFTFANIFIFSPLRYK